MELQMFGMDSQLSRWLEEDIGSGDITTEAIVAGDARAKAVIHAKAPGVLAGVTLARRVFSLLDPQVEFAACRTDGDTLTDTSVIATVEGRAQALLMGERLALNLLQHLSGVATAAHRLSAIAAPFGARLVDTRKTTPGLRAFEKYAVRCGGGMNHRFGLDDAVLIKDNHIAVAGGVVAALRAAKRHAGHLVKIEIEVDRLDQLDEVIAEGADVVLLDNMSLADLSEGVRRVASRMKVEASGGVSLDTVKAIAETGVDIISIGALTHSAPVLDLGLDVEIG